jgi:MYXO-CTERM domain-containing protein
MKTTLLVSVLLIFSAAPAFAQAHPVSTGSDDTSRSSSDHNYGWIGLIGLLGLAGLRRQKSLEHQRMEAAGVNVQSVRTTPH